MPRLTAATEWAELDHVPVRANQINIRHDGASKTTLANVKGPSIVWRACFPGSFSTLLLEGKPIEARHHAAVAAQTISCATVDVGLGNRRTVQVAK
jgi:hypothetical protein